LYVIENKEDSQARAAVYRVLALSFYPPTAETNQIWHALNQLKLGHEESKQPLKSNASFDVEALSFEYNRLFVGPERLPCPPYESVHRKDRSELEMGMVLGPSVLDVKRRYAEAGLEISKTFKDLPDHIAVELEFMHYLCSKELETENPEVCEKLRRIQAEFFRLHLLPWASSFADKIADNTASPFYGKVAFLLMEFMNDEERFLDSS
jgi:putative dimethyl sulfoxide reductase chaperone